MLEQADNAMLHLGSGQVMVGEPDESQGYGLALGQLRGQQLLVLAVGFAQLPLHAVAVDGMLEAALRDTDKNLRMGV